MTPTTIPATQPTTQSAPPPGATFINDVVPTRTQQNPPGATVIPATQPAERATPPPGATVIPNLANESGDLDVPAGPVSEG